MQNLLLTGGLICLVASIVGGGIRLLGGEVPVLDSKFRQFLLALFGIALLVWAAVITPVETPSAPRDISSPPLGPLTDGNAENGDRSVVSNQNVAPSSSPDQESPGIDRGALESERRENKDRIETLQKQMESGDANAASLRQGIETHSGQIAAQNQLLQQGVGTAEDRSAAVAAIKDAQEADAKARTLLEGYAQQRDRTLTVLGVLKQRNSEIDKLLEK